ncbi:hypothetical protein OHS33_21680 [Streptomyces sp. NBC_00536]|uniref:hypothetical protein n=1 Tax=Streptomyces sp. NBC_00536 TaxID=2975769 RepID=UPI002E804399|nr:hypothetical protein [Streptomyces sp. NBC_00536]WUC80704.1 hypothetical protein OHS33_21680 [Streptomyces sp. NBC_00536]
MRSTLVRRSVLTASAVSLALLVTACGSDKAAKDEPKGGGASSAAPSAPAADPAAKAKTAAELKAQLVTQADLAEYKVKEAAPDEVTGAAAAYATTKAECQPLAQAMSGAGVGKSVGSAATKVSSVPKAPAADASPEEKLKAIKDAAGVTVTMVSLSSYDGKGAADAFAAVKAAGTACVAGYPGAKESDTGKVTKVTEGTPVSAGDEAVAFAVERDADGDKLATQLVVVRKGNTLASFYSLSPLTAAAQPKAIVDAQVKKLG